MELSYMEIGKRYVRHRNCWTAYYSTNKMMYQHYQKGGKTHGSAKAWNPDGELIYDSIYKNGSFITNKKNEKIL